MAAFTSLLGETLQTKDGNKPTADVLGKCDAVGIYFSAHWCPPCRRFTPELAAMYKKLRAEGKQFEVVFVSSDKDASAFDEYYGEMPWTCVPFAEREIKKTLSKKYKVSGIPTLVILDSGGNTITTDGRSAVSSPEKFPWIPPTLGELLTGPFIGSDGAEIESAAIKDKHIALYFSAHWCGPCRGFTPEFAKMYKKLSSDKFEVIFVSSDRDEAAFKEYHAEMPWIALPFANRDAKNALSSRFDVQGIPSVVVLGPADEDGNREVINADARGPIGGDPDGANFPWRPPALPALDDCSSINDTPTVVILADGCSTEKVTAIRNDIEPAAIAARDAAKAAGADGPDVGYCVAAPGDGLAPRVRQLFGLGEPSDAVKVVLVDLGDDGAYYHGEDHSASAIEALIAGYKAGSLDRQSLE